MVAANCGAYNFSEDHYSFSTSSKVTSPPGTSPFSFWYPVDWRDSVLLAPRYPEDSRDSVLLAPRYPEDWSDSVLLAQYFWPSGNLGTGRHGRTFLSRNTMCVYKPCAAAFTRRFSPRKT